MNLSDLLAAYLKKHGSVNLENAEKTFSVTMQYWLMYQNGELCHQYVYVMTYYGHAAPIIVHSDDTDLLIDIMQASPLIVSTFETWCNLYLLLHPVAA